MTARRLRRSSRSIVMRRQRATGIVYSAIDVKKSATEIPNIARQHGRGAVVAVVRQVCSQVVAWFWSVTACASRRSAVRQGLTGSRKQGESRFDGTAVVSAAG